MSRPQVVELELPLQQWHARRGQAGNGTTIRVRLRLVVGGLSRSEKCAAAAAILQLAGDQPTVAGICAVIGSKGIAPAAARWLESIGAFDGAVQKMDLQGHAAAHRLAQVGIQEALATLIGMPPAALMRMLRMDWAGAQRLFLAFALHRRLLAAGPIDRVACRTPEEIARLMKPLLLIDHERLWCLPLDPHCRLIGEPVEVARGDVDGTDAGPRACCRAALRVGAVSMVVVHNHPSGDPSPSAADRAVTRRLATGARTIDVPLQDHLICTSHGAWISLRRDHPELFM